MHMKVRLAKLIILILFKSDLINNLHSLVLNV